MEVDVCNKSDQTGCITTCWWVIIPASAYAAVPLFHRTYNAPFMRSGSAFFSRARNK